MKRCKAISITVAVLTTIVLQGCFSSDFMNVGKRTIYPCTVACGDKRITPPKGYVYYQDKIMSIEEFNRITHQHLVIQ